MNSRKDSLERKEELMNIAMELFLSKGYEETSIKDIILQADVAYGLFYYYFDTKEAVLVEIVQRWLNAYIAVLTNVGFFACKNVEGAIQLFAEGSNIFMTQFGRVIEALHMESNGMIHNVATKIFLKFISDAVMDIMRIGNESGEYHFMYIEQSAKALVYGIYEAIHDDTNRFGDEKRQLDLEFIQHFLSKVLN